MTELAPALQPMTTYISFASDGGRIGRIHWRNTGAPAPLFWQRPGWGQFAWDSLWPLPHPERSGLMEQIRRLNRQLADGFQSVTASMAQAAESFVAFGRAARAISPPLTPIALPVAIGELSHPAETDAPGPTELW